MSSRAIPRNGTGDRRAARQRDDADVPAPRPGPARATRAARWRRPDGPAEQGVEEVAACRGRGRRGARRAATAPAGGRAGGDGGPAALPGRQAADGDVPQPAVETERASAAAMSSSAGAAGAAPEAHVLRDREVVVEARRRGRGGRHGADRTGGPVVGRAEDEASPRMTAARPAQSAQQRGLAGAVRAAEEDDLAPRRRRGRSGQRGEASEERDRGAEVDDGLHGEREGSDRPSRPPR